MITVSKDERAELSEDEYWIDDIVGIRVLDSASEAELGILEEVIRTGSNDVYTHKDGGRTAEADPRSCGSSKMWTRKQA